MKTLTLLPLFCLLATAAIGQTAPLTQRVRDSNIQTRFPPIESPADLNALLGGASIAEFATPGVPARRTPLAVAKGRRAIQQLSKVNAADGLEVLGDIRRADNGTVQWMTGELGRIPAGKTHGLATFAQAASDILAAKSRSLRIEKADQFFQVSEIQSDDLGFTHVRLDQTIGDTPVWGRDIYIHFDDVGDAYALNGSYTPNVEPPPGDALLTEEAAVSIVVDKLRSESRWVPVEADPGSMLSLSSPDASLVYYPTDDEIRLTYEVDIHPNLIERYTFIVDARSGEILHRIAEHCSLVHEDSTRPVRPAEITFRGPSARPASSGFFQDAFGIDLHGVAQSFRTFQADNGFSYLVWDLPNLDYFDLNSGQAAGGAVTFSANYKDLGEDVLYITSPTNTWGDPTAVSAHVNMKLAYSYYADTFERAAISDDDQTILSIVHAKEAGSPLDQAYWNGRFMIYGDGHTTFYPLAGGLDVAGHEMTHGVIQHSAKLIYQNQSGALNESFADVFGVMIDRNDLLIGEDITRPTAGIALRDMLHPSNPDVLDVQPQHMDDFEEVVHDNGGVHINSGIPNRAAAIIIQTIGRDATERIYYRALTKYLTRNSQFLDARQALIQSATDIHGAGSQEATVVAVAFDEVGIIPDGSGEKEDNDVPPVSGEKELIAFRLQDGRIGLLNTDTYSMDVIDSPDAVVRASSQLSTARSGERIYFVNSEGKLACASVRTNDVYVYDDLYIAQPGDLRSAVIAPNESVVALSSTDLKDATLYFFAGDQSASIPLRVTTTQDGIENDLIRYPDVVSWSPNTEQPRIAFDALNNVELGGGAAINYWSMYEIDFESGQIYDLIPGQPTDVDIGNITYSSTDPDHVAYNVISPDGVYDIFQIDFDDGMYSDLGISDSTIDGDPIGDAATPTFSPDDSRLSFTSAANNALLFYDLESSSVLPYYFDSPVTSPHWFVLGGETGTAREDHVVSTEGLTLHSAYPNPATASTTVSFDLSEGTDVEIHLVDLLGRRVQTVLTGYHHAGSHQTTVPVTGLVAGLYRVLLTTDRGSKSKPLHVIRTR